ncbi:MAG: twin-arginine translocase TatA/TatE family subunit [Bacteroidetes bacterium]|nr:twin-arginine translocase TatA/TatE family subunit [Bacteroidota bacterium]
MILLFLNIGGSEVFLIVLVILMFFGSKSIPTLARGLGKGLREFKDATQGIQREIENSATSIKKEIDVTEEVKKHLGE